MSDIDIVFDNNSDDDSSEPGLPADPSTDLGQALLLKGERERALLIHGLLKRLDGTNSDAELTAFAEDCLRKGIIQKELHSPVVDLIGALRTSGTALGTTKIAEDLRTILKSSINQFKPKLLKYKIKSTPTRDPASIPLKSDTYNLNKLLATKPATTPTAPIFQEEAKTSDAIHAKSISVTVQKSLEEFSKAEKKEHEEKLHARDLEDDEKKRAIKEVYVRTKAAGKPIQLDPNFRIIKLSDVEQIVNDLLTSQQDHNQKPQ